MEFGTREILILLGIVVIFGILLDGLRRVRQSRSGSLKIGRRKQAIFDDEDAHDLPTDLLTGQVRVTRRDEQSVEEVSDNIRRFRERSTDKQTSVYRQRQDPDVVPFHEPDSPQDADGRREPEFREEDFHPDPAAEAADPADEVDSRAATEEFPAADVPSRPDHGIEDTDDAAASDVALSEFEIDEPEPEDIAPKNPDDAERESRREAETPPPAGASAEVPLTASRDDDEPAVAREPFHVNAENDTQDQRRRPFWEERDPRDAKASSTPEKTGPSPDRDEAPSQNDVIILHVMAKQGGVIKGEALLDALLENNLRYGAMKIFHRHENRDGSGPVRFSLANSLNPGTFDLAAMDKFETPGVTLLMPLEGLNNPLEAYKELIKVAQNLSRSLNAVVQDETRSVLTKQTIEHYRQQIIEFTRRSFTLTN